MVHQALLIGMNCKITILSYCCQLARL